MRASTTPIAPTGALPVGRHLRKYVAVARATLATQTAYLTEMLLRTVFLGLILFVFVQLWSVTYDAMGTRVVAGFSVAQMVWYLMFTESIVLTRPRLTREIDSDVRGGDIAYQLVRPYDYVLFRLAAYLAERVLRLATTLAVGVPLALLLVGPVPLSAAALVGASAVVLLAILVDYFFTMIVGLLAFWLEDTQPISLLYDRAVMLLGGMLLPLELLPEGIAAVCAALPFQLLLYAPSRMAISGDVTVLPATLGHLVVTLGFAILIVRGLYGVASRRLLANGG